jgi:hypothetical protein
MSNESWDDEFNRLLKPVVPVTLEYRVYYDDDGIIYRCSMQQHEPGDYIVVPKEQYDLYYHYRVVRGQMVKIDTDARYRVQLQRSTSGYATVAGHAGLLIEEDEEYPDIEYHARTN